MFELDEEQFRDLARTIEQVHRYLNAYDECQSALRDGPVTYSNLTISIFEVKNMLMSINEEVYNGVTEEID